MATNDPYNLNAGYGFPVPPNEEIIQALLAQNQMGNTAAAAQPRLAKQMDRAVALRDREAPKSTHWLSGLAALGNKAAGIRDVKETEQQQIRGEQALGNSLAAQQKAAMEAQSRNEGTALANTRLELANREEDYVRETAADKLKATALARHQAAERQHDKDMAAMKADGGEAAQRISTLDGRDLTANYSNGVWTTPGGEQIPQDQVYVPGDTKRATQKERAYMRDIKYKSEITEKYLAEGLPYWKKVAQPLQDRNIPTEILNKAIRQGETQGLYDFLEGKEVLGFKFGEVTKEERADILESTRALSDLMANVVNPFIEDSIAGAASDDDVRRLMAAIRIQGGGSGEELMQQAHQLLSRVRGQVREQSRIYANDGDLGSHRLGRDALKVLDAGDKKIQEGRMTPEQRVITQEPVEYPEGVTKESYAEAVKMIAEDPREQARLEAYVEQNPDKHPAWTFAVQQMKEKQAKVNELRQPMP